MLTPDSNNGDGRKTSYLNDKTYYYIEPIVFKVLKKLVDTGSRSISAVEASNIVSADFYSQIQDKYGEAELVFFDPDNGLETRVVQKSKLNQYLLWSHLWKVYQDGYSILVYQHFPRMNRELFITKMNRRIISKLGPVKIKHYCTGMVDFILILQIKHGDIEIMDIGGITVK
jgi:hypothetical protein